MRPFAPRSFSSFSEAEEDNGQSRTHAFQSVRPSTTEFIGDFTDPGGVQASEVDGGEIQILDLEGLKAASCSCYQIVQTAFNRVQGPIPAVG